LRLGSPFLDRVFVIDQPWLLAELIQLEVEMVREGWYVCLSLNCEKHVLVVKLVPGCDR
jgi:hypothetical protein